MNNGLVMLKNFIKKYSVIFLCSMLSIFSWTALWTFHPTDNSWFYHDTSLKSYQNIFGFLGAHYAALMIYLCGSSVFFVPCLMAYAATLYYYMVVVKKINFATEWDRVFGCLLAFLSSAALCQIYKINHYDFAYPGGLLGSYVVSHFLTSFDILTQKIIVFCLLVVAFILGTRCAYMPFLWYCWQGILYCCDRTKLPARFVLFIYNFFKSVLYSLIGYVQKIFYVLTGAVVRKLDSSIVEFEHEGNVDQDIERVVQDLFWQEYVVEDENRKIKPASVSLGEQEYDFDDDFREDQPTLYQQKTASESGQNKVHFSDFSSQRILEQQEKFDASLKIDAEKKVATSVVQRQEVKNLKTYSLPALPVKKVEQKTLQEKQEVLAMQARLLEEKLEQFDIKGAVVAMHAGPVVTLFEYQPDIKVKVSRILALEDDLAMALKALSIRIIAPIPGRSVVGFEVSNQHRQDVVMAKILQSSEFKKYTGALPLIFGQDTLGNDVVADLAKMPHLLIAGSTGSGKSVALNAMLVSLLCSLRPDQLKLIIIDPKRLEFAAYDGIAHLLFPIVTDTKKAIPILKWVVQTMEQRYETMAKFGVRNLADYQVAAQKNKEMEYMPLIVVIIDELADLMMTAGKAVEDSIARIAQMARAAGIHMIIATQRPSVDVITGMIKVNFPNRVAFKVTSKIDSRTILDAAGAEKLLGRGDMLFLDASKSHLVRVHGAYISDQEIHDVVAQIKRQAPAQYLDLAHELGNGENEELLDGDDELYQEILEFIQDLDEVSISMLQRRFRIGYNRSARIISILESKGLIMSVEGGKTRRVIK